jgi:hypothetical protein
MGFSVNSYYRIYRKNKKPVEVKIIESPLAFHLIRVEEIESKKEDYLIEYLRDESAEVLQIISPAFIKAKELASF